MSAELWHVLPETEGQHERGRRGVWLAPALGGMSSAAEAVADWMTKRPLAHPMARATRASTPNAFQDGLRKCLAQVLAERSLPVGLPASACFHVPKSNGRQGCKARRVLHGFSPINKALLSTLWEMQSSRPALDCQFGCVPGRSREEALLIHLVSGYRVGHAGFLVGASYFDMSDAFDSVRRQCVSQMSKVD